MIAALLAFLGSAHRLNEAWARFDDAFALAMAGRDDPLAREAIRRHDALRDAFGSSLEAWAKVRRSLRRPN